MIVEDDHAIRETLKAVLESEGYAVETASNGREGLDILHRQEPPCLVLLDFMMPVLSGVEFLKEKNADFRLAPIPVIVVSALANQIKGTGAHVYVQKPIDLDVLLELVQSYCG